MHQSWRAAITAATVMVAGAAQAHDFVVLKLVNGRQTLDITSYPTTVTVTTVALNSHPTLPSTLLTATDPLLVPYGWTFTPPLPQSVPVDGNLISYYNLTINSFEDCVTLGNADDDPTTPGPLPNASFTNTFAASWDSGTAQSSVRVTCAPANRLPCDDSLYYSDSGLGLPNTRLSVMDTATADLTPLSNANMFYGATAFNHLDGYIYAIDNALVGKSLVRIGADGVATTVGPLPELNILSTYRAGTVLQDGTYLVYSGPGTSVIPTYARINLTTGTVISSGPAPSLAVVLDFAVNPIDNQVYGYNDTTHRLTRFDPATGNTTDFGPIGPPDGLTGLPALYFTATAAAFDSAGTFYVYGSDLTGLVHPVNTLYTVNLTTGAFTVAAVGDVSLNGNENFASCPFPSSVQEKNTTRNEGFFKTHEEALSACLAAGGDIDLGRVGVVRSMQEAMGVLWLSPAATQRRVPRTEEQSLLVKLARQSLTATCNERLFGAVMTPGIARARSAMDSGTREDMETQLNALRALNDKGARLALPMSFNGGPASASHALSIAVEPKGSL